MLRRAASEPSPGLSIHKNDQKSDALRKHAEVPELRDYK